MSFPFGYVSLTICDGECLLFQSILSPGLHRIYQSHHDLCVATSNGLSVLTLFRLLSFYWLIFSSWNTPSHWAPWTFLGSLGLFCSLPMWSTVMVGVLQVWVQVLLFSLSYLGDCFCFHGSQMRVASIFLFPGHQSFTFHSLPNTAIGYWWALQTQHSQKGLLASPQSSLTLLPPHYVTSNTCSQNAGRVLILPSLHPFHPVYHYLLLSLFPKTL